MKVTAHIFEAHEVSDDPRAIQATGGASMQLVRIARNSAWLIRAYVRAYENRYDDTLIVSFRGKA